MKTIAVGTYRVEIPEGAQESGGGYIVKGKEIRLGLPFEAVRYYRHGWQSWTLAGWVEPGRRLPPMKPRILNPMQCDPVYALEKRPNGSWAGAVEAPGGEVLLLGALSLETHTALDGRSLLGWTEAGEAEWFLAAGDEAEVFGAYAERLGERFGRGRELRAPRVWCSWYSLYGEISERRLLNALTGLEGLAFDVFQVDDGWQMGIGEWEANGKFPGGMGRLAEQIRASGRRAGLWLAPLLAVPSTRLYREHRDWLLHDERGRLVSAGFNWGEPLYALDTTHPGALEWLAALMKKVRGWGYDYLKLDFLYGGALPGKRYLDLPREAAYRHGLKVVREALGEAYFVTCGAPILPSIGLCDGLRAGADVAERWERHLETQLLDNHAVPSGRNGLRNTVNRLWLRPLVQIDPDVAYFRAYGNGLSAAERRMLQDLALITGFKATSDLPEWLNGEERAELEKFLEAAPRVERVGRGRFRVEGREVDFSQALELPRRKTVMEAGLSAVLGPLTSLPLALRLNDWLGRRAVRRKVGTEE